MRVLDTLDGIKAHLNTIGLHQVEESLVKRAFTIQQSGKYNFWLSELSVDYIREGT
jgi:hypothetical protein